VYFEPLDRIGTELNDRGFKGVFKNPNSSWVGWM